MSTDLHTIPPMPAPLDPTKYHTRAEALAHQEAIRAHVEGKRAAERREREAAKPRVHHVTDAEYEAAALARYNEQQAKDLERKVAEAAEAQRREEWLASTPETVEISANNPASFIRDLVHWAGKGYVPDFDKMWNVDVFFCNINMARPAKRTKAVA